MLGELELLLRAVPGTASREHYRLAVIEDNALLKPSSSTRARTYSYLRDRFALDPTVGIFAALRLLWDRDVAGQPLMALLVAAFRDPVLRATVPFVISVEPGRSVTSSEFGRTIAEAFPGRLGPKTLKSTGENTTSTYKQSGHLQGRTHCIRQRVNPTPGSVTLALLLASLDDASGFSLLDSAWVHMLDGTPEQILSEARIASGRGWLELRQAGDVLDITFHSLLSSIGWDS